MLNGGANPAHVATCVDAFNLLCGEKLGAGIHREVFACTLRPDLVVKVETADNRWFANVMEMKFWNDHECYKPVAQWLAPCAALSPDGRVLLQWRCDPVPQSYRWPKLPQFLTDLKADNFGLYRGRLVCVDYAMTVPNPSTRLRAVKIRA